jgi:hypothetical protein
MLFWRGYGCPGSVLGGGDRASSAEATTHPPGPRRSDKAVATTRSPDPRQRRPPVLPVLGAATRQRWYRCRRSTTQSKRRAGPCRRRSSAAIVLGQGRMLGGSAGTVLEQEAAWRRPFRPCSSAAVKAAGRLGAGCFNGAGPSDGQTFFFQGDCVFGAGKGARTGPIYRAPLRIA